MRRAAVLLCCLLLAGCGGPVAELGATPTDADGTATPTDADGTATLTENPTASGTETWTRSTAASGSVDRSARVDEILASGRAAVRVVDANGTLLAVVNASIADEFEERYTGLSEATSLENGSGMLFVYESEASRTFVMREMAFPLDMVFVGANRTITAIHHAPVEDDDLTRYEGSARWVLEVPYGWTTARGIDVGETIAIAYPGNASNADGQ